MSNIIKFRSKFELIEKFSFCLLGLVFKRFKPPLNSGIKKSLKSNNSKDLRHTMYVDLVWLIDILHEVENQRLKGSFIPL
jgi:hypothetical protein